MITMELDYKWTPEDIFAKGMTTKEDLETIKTWLSTLNDEYLPPNIQDHLLVLFLISCVNNIELTKKTILSYYKLKQHAPEIFDDRNLKRSELQTALNTIHLSSIPVRTDEGDVIHYFKLNDSNYNNFDLVQAMKVSYMIMDVTHEKNPPPGLIVLIDMKGFGLMHMTKLKIGAVKKYFSFLQEALPLRMKEIHILNSVYFIDKILALIKVFMKSELMDLVHFHSPGIEQEKMFEIAPKKCLPKDYGGDLPSASELHDITLQQFKDRQEFWNIEEMIRKEAPIWKKS
ncbi:alpha-tocopherol transfer protein-like isoform X1 [Leptinotarsa decemlineata]|uniref:alpha-tocopherol transfer protein-like isoform X1 n=2 Tax=Leptinotarsa decemlineata TaxID=7539 RepID=UPI003D30B363